MQTDISVALATYNGARFLRDQLDSLARQTLLPSELVVSDDASTDESLEILQEFASCAPFNVRIYLNQARLGFGENFMNAAGHCGGALIAFCDQDDVWKEEKLERCYAEFSRPDVVAVIHRADEVDIHLRPFGIRWPRIGARIVLPRGQSHPEIDSAAGSWMVLRSCVVREVLRLWPSDHSGCVRNLGTTTILAHDFTSYYVAKAMGSIAYIPDVLVLHRQHGSNTASWSSDQVLRLQSVLSTGAETYAKNSLVLSAAAGFYCGMAQKACGEITASLNALGMRLRHVSEAFGARARLYSSNKRIQRLKTASLMLRSGMYSHPLNGGLGRNAAAKDLLYAIIGSHPNAGLQGWAARLCERYRSACH